MGYYIIGALVLLAGAAGVAFVTLDPFAEDQSQDEVTSLSEPVGDDTASADPGESPVIQGSAARRMDDFGSGPSGNAVTVPLRDRHRQAYASGDTIGGGGASPQDGAPTVRVMERDVTTLKNQPGEEAPGDDGNRSDVAESPADPVIRPTFDVVRVDPAGSTVIAGRAMPSTEVDIKVGDQVIDRVTTTSSGEWVSIPSNPLAPGDQELSLTAVSPSGEVVDSRQIVIVSVPEAIARVDDSSDPVEPEETVALLLNKDESGAGRILQAPDKLESAGNERLALTVVDYDDRGAIRLTGEAPPGVPVRIYVDNVPSALVIGDSKGDWITTLDQNLPAGDYTLRLDQLDANGQAVARLETPLTRVAQPPVEGATQVDYVVVQPGNSLWRIARRLSGDGFNYVYIFEANESQIRDPDIIYPGQVFEVPSTVGVAG
jgi:LysM repeat protein